MQPKSQILEKVDALLSADIPDTQYDKMIPLENPLSCAITEQKGPTADFLPFYSSKPQKTREGYILSILGHLSANPSNPEKKDILSQVYIYSESSEIRNSDIPNTNSKSAQEFINELNAASKLERDMYLLNNSITRSLYILHGDRGIGKTIFINHLFTKYNDYLNEKKTIWIRINLAEDFGGDDPNLIHWLLSKAVMVVFRYYIHFHDFSGLIDRLKDYIVHKFKDNTKDMLLENLQILVDMFVSKEYREVLNSELVNDLISRRVLHEAINNGYSFIYVLDGFDRIDITPKYKTIFDNLNKRLNTLTHLDTKLGGCFLIVTRTETTRYMASTNLFATSKSRNSIFKGITGVDFDKIIDKRFTYLSKIIESKGNVVGWSLVDWPLHLDEFKVYLTSVSEKSSFENFSEYINDIYGNNNRAKAQLLQLCYNDYLESKKHPKRYQLIESMCKGGFMYPPQIYYYSEDSNKRGPDAHAKMFDNVFITTLVRFPYSDKRKWTALPISKTYTLAGLRVIQLIEAYEMLYNNGSGQMKFFIPISTLLSDLDALFHYDRDIIISILEEFYEYGYINLDGDELLIPERVERYKAKSTPKMKFIYFSSLSTLFNEIAYLNMCSMRLLLNRDYFRKDIPFIKALTLDDGKVRISEWTIWKIINSISICRVLKAIHSKEYKYVEENKNILGDGIKDLLKVMKLTVFNKEAVLKKIQFAINDMPDDTVNSLGRQLRIYENNWALPKIE